MINYFMIAVIVLLVLFYLLYIIVGINGIKYQDAPAGWIRKTFATLLRWTSKILNFVFLLYLANVLFELVGYYSFIIFFIYRNFLLKIICYLVISIISIIWLQTFTPLILSLFMFLPSIYYKDMFEMQKLEHYAQILEGVKENCINEFEEKYLNKENNENEEEDK